MWQRIREFFSGLFGSSDDDEGKPPKVEGVPPPNTAPISAFFATIAADKNNDYTQFVTAPDRYIDNYPNLTPDQKKFLKTAIKQGKAGYDDVHGRMTHEAADAAAMVWICIWIHQTPNPPPHTGPGTGPSPGDG